MTLLLDRLADATVTPRTRGKAGLIATRVDYLLVIPTLALAALGVVAVYSVTRPQLLAAGAHPTHYLHQQLLYAVLGLVAMVVTVSFHYRRYERLGVLAYVAVVVGLLAVLSPIGSSALGSQRWIALGPFDFQPSAFASLALVATIAAYGQRHRHYQIGPKRLALLLAITVPVMLLVVKQPDLGTALTMAAVLLAVLTALGVRGRWLAALIGLSAAAAVVIVAGGLLHHYQVQRLTSFLNQGATGSAYSAAQYNLTQSKLAITSGGLTGSGLFHGPMTNLGEVPEQQTDFIFSAIGEQLGFAGSAAVLACYLLIAWRTWRAAMLARDIYGRLLCVGVLTMIVFSVFQNVGMAIGIMPITGIPLPFLSYGGSATIAYFTAVGLVVNVAVNRVPLPTRIASVARWRPSIRS